MIRALIVDDSAYSRRAIKSMLESSGRVEVVGVAMDGETGLRAVSEFEPDVITLDLEMPGLNGFAFLRILMRRRPTPVIVVSSWAGREDVLRALELGALDFVAKPSKSTSPALMEIQEELVTKVVEAGSARMDVYLKDRPMDVTGFFTLPEVDPSGSLKFPSSSPAASPAAASPAAASPAAAPPAAAPPAAAPAPSPPRPEAKPPPSSSESDLMDSPVVQGKSMTGAYRLLTEKDLEAATGASRPAARSRSPSSPGMVSLSALEEEAAAPAAAEGIVVVGASTGGPRAIRKILGAYQRPLPWPMLIVQHMPPRFTTEFARRLARKLGHDVREATDGERLVPGRVLVAPGGLHTEIDISASDRLPFVRLRVPTAEDRYVPSVDKAMITASRVFGTNVVGVVLTGMGNDGVQGVYAVRWAGGRVIAEDQSSAVVFGMPREAISTGVVETVTPLDFIPGEIVRMINLQS